MITDFFLTATEDPPDTSPATKAHQIVTKVGAAMRFRPCPRRLARSVAAVLLLGAAVGDLAGAMTISVDSTADASDANPGDGICASASDGCTLRAAIDETNALHGADTIALPAGTYTLSRGTPPYGAILTIMDDLDLVGAGAASTVIDGAGVYLVLHVWLKAIASLPPSRVLIRGVTIANGNGVTGPSSGIVAAGIWNQALLTLENCVVRNHNGHLGAAIVNQDSVDPRRHPRLTMRNTEVRDNVTQTNGAGMTVGERGRVTVEGCLFSNNHADVGYGYGGAVATGRRSKLLVTGSQFTGNSAGNGGGALSIAGSAEIADSVISGNTTAGNGGGIFRAPSEDEHDRYYSPGRLKLVDTTITGNRADSDDSGHNFGGGVMSGSRGLLRIGGTISGNFGTGGAPDDCTCFY
jgi:CSLREA domain-containing protein